MKPILALLFLLAFPVVAFAQTIAPTVITGQDLIAPWLQLLFGAAAIIIPAVATFAAAELRRRTGITIQQAHMNTFQTALTNAAGLFLTKIGQSAQGIQFDVRHPAIKDVILYVNKSAPDAVEYFGLSPEQIAEKLMAKIGVLTAQEHVVNVENGPKNAAGDTLVGRVIT